MSEENLDFSAAKDVEVTATSRRGKKVTYVLTDSGKAAVGIADTPPQCQIIWEAILAVLKDHETDEFTLDWANKLCTFLVEHGKLVTKQDHDRIFTYYRSLDAKTMGGRGFLSRGWLTIKK